CSPPRPGPSAKPSPTLSTSDPTPMTPTPCTRSWPTRSGHTTPYAPPTPYADISTGPTRCWPGWLVDDRLLGQRPRRRADVLGARRRRPVPGRGTGAAAVHGRPTRLQLYRDRRADPRGDGAVLGGTAGVRVVDRPARSS